MAARRIETSRSGQAQRCRGARRGCGRGTEASARRPGSSASDMRLLVTRPDPDAHRRRRCGARGHEVARRAADADRNRRRPNVTGPFGAVLITSANAAHALLDASAREGLRALPVIAVGARSAEAAREAGFASVESADGALGRSGAARGGAVRRAAAASIWRARIAPAISRRSLAPHGIVVETVVIYRAIGSR